MSLYSSRAFSLLLGGASLLYAHSAQAQPSDAQTIRDLTSRGVLSVKLKGRGARVWSTASRQYVWDRSAVVVRKAGIPEFPNARLEIGGIATYSIVGGRFPFKKFYVTYNSYLGIPAPSTKQVTALVKTDLPEFLGNAYNSIVGDVGPITLASNPQWDWHTPNSVSVRLSTNYQRKISDTQLGRTTALITVRLYRDAIKKPWTRISANNHTETSLGVSTRDADELRAMKTLNVLHGERATLAHLAGLPAVQVPSFATDLELFGLLHKTFLQNDRKKTEAVLRRCLAPSFYVEGSSILLNSEGEALVQEVLKKVHGGNISYSEQYPADLNVSDYKVNDLGFWHADGRHRSSMTAVPVGGTWQNGVKVGESVKLKDISISIVSDAEEIARLRSIPPATRFAPPAGSTRFSGLGQQVVAAQNAQLHAEAVRAIKWTPFTSTNAHLKIAFPAKPTETQGQMNGKYPMWTVEASNDKALCRAISIAYPTRLNRLQAQTTIDSVVQNLVQANNAKVKIQSEVTTGTYGKIATLEAEGVVMNVHVYALGNMVYQLILSTSPETLANLDGRAFFNSFEPLR